MIPVQALSKFIIGVALDGVKSSLAGEVKNAAREQMKEAALKSQMQNVKALLGEQIAQNFLDQVKERSEGYIEAVQDIELDVDFDESSDNINVVVNNVLKRLNIFLNTKYISYVLLIFYAVFRINVVFHGQRTVIVIYCRLSDVLCMFFVSYCYFYEFGLFICLFSFLICQLLCSYWQFVLFTYLQGSSLSSSMVFLAAKCSK